MRLLVYATSNSSRSINRQLVRHAAAVLQAEILPTVEPELINIHDYEMPIYSFDREAADGIPQRAQDFRDLIDRADALLVPFLRITATFRRPIRTSLTGRRACPARSIAASHWWPYRPRPEVAAAHR